MIYAFLKNDDTPQALSYIGNLMDEAQQIKTIANTANYMINTIFNSKMTLFEKENIRTDFQAGEVPAHLPLSDPELCSLLLNILDNAVDGVRPTALPDRTLEIKMFTKNHYFYFYCKNPTQNSSQEDTSNTQGPMDHGYGLDIVHQITKKYNGMMNIENNGGFFAITLAIPIHE